MAHLHLTRELLDAIHDGRRNPGDLVPVVMSHLFDLCPSCSEVFHSWQESLAAAPAEDLDEALQRVRSRSQTLALKIGYEKNTSRERIQELLSLPKDQRLEAISAAGSRFRGVALASLLITESRENLPFHPRESWACAELAKAVLEHSDFGILAVEIYARAMAYTANAWRVLARLDEAASAMRDARFLLRSGGGGDRMVRAELDNLEGHLSADQRKFPAAVQLLRRAVIGYRSAGAEQEALRSSLNLALAHLSAGDVDSSLEILRDVEERLEGEDSMMLSFTRHNLTLALCDAGEYHEAQARLEFLRTDKNLNQTKSLLRVAWLGGKIALGLKDYETAERHLEEAAYGFAVEELPYEHALVKLELALTYLHQRRLDEVHRLAQELVASFRDWGIQREAVAAAMLFEESVRLGQITLALIEQLTRYFEQAERNPSVPFDFGT